MTDNVVVITGGSRGIGRATAFAAAKRGLRVVVGYASNKAAADEVVGDDRGQATARRFAVKCDVGEESDILALFKAADAFGTLGALVNNAGIVGQRRAGRRHVGRAHPAHDGASTSPAVFSVLAKRSSVCPPSTAARAA